MPVINYLGGNNFNSFYNLIMHHSLACSPLLVFEARKLGLSVIGVDGDFTLVREQPELFVVHDFTKGKLENFQKYYLTAEFDLIWCVEFVEHIDETYVDNWMSLTHHIKSNSAVK
jgi:2-polyprenyl-3-methyl-5-hydroxy-6-metoxy-1,4-benzoquinol methylase